MHILLDPGHGGRDKGAQVKTLSESSLVLQMSKVLKSRIEKDPHFKVSLTRQIDEFKTLRDRTEISHHVQADLFLSLHLNSSPDPRVSGAEFYFQNQLPPDEESLYLAHKENEFGDQEHDPFSPTGLVKASLKPEIRTILTDLMRSQKIANSSLLSKSLRQSWRGVKRSPRLSIRQAPFYVVSQTAVPSVLVELGFLTHPEEGRKLTQSWYHQVIAESLYQGLRHYKDLIDKSPTSLINNSHAEQSKTLE